MAYRSPRNLPVHPWHSETGVSEGVWREWTVPGTLPRVGVATVNVSDPRQVFKALRGIAGRLE